jgi:hypothetical protein
VKVRRVGSLTSRVFLSAADRAVAQDESLDHHGTRCRSRLPIQVRNGSWTAQSASCRRGPHERLAATPHSIAPLRQVVIDFARRSGASDRRCDDIAVAVSEALSNVVVHAYAGQVEAGVVTVDAWMSNQSLEVIVCDEASGCCRAPTTAAWASGWRSSSG